MSKRNRGQLAHRQASIDLQNEFVQQWLEQRQEQQQPREQQQQEQEKGERNS